MNKEEMQQKFIQEHPNFSYEGRYKKNEYMKIYKLKNKIKVDARKKVFIALRNKTLIKENCFCGNTKSEAHHKDYSKPLDIIWLCKKHHIIADKQDNNKLNTSI